MGADEKTGGKRHGHGVNTGPDGQRYEGDGRERVEVAFRGEVGTVGAGCLVHGAGTRRRQASIIKRP